MDIQPIIKVPKDVWNTIIGYRGIELKYISIQNIADKRNYDTVKFKNIKYFSGPHYIIYKGIRTKYIELVLSKKKTEKTSIKVWKSLQPILYNMLFEFIVKHDPDHQHNKS